MRRCCQSGVRCPGRRRGIRSARAAFSRKREPKSAVCADLLDDEVLELLRLDEQVGERGRRVGVREVERDPVVRPERLHLEPERVADPRRERHRPGRVDAPAERRQEADAPVADLVAEPLDDDRAVGRAGAEVRSCSRRNVEQVPRRPLVEVVVGAEALPRARRPRARRARASPRRSAAPSSYGRPTPSPFQNGTAPGHARGRRDEHAVARDLLDPPRRGAEHERLPLARLVDHLLVELADPAAALDLEDAEEAAVGDRPGVRHREPARAGAAADHAGRPVPDDARPELGELVRRVAAGEHVEDVLELRRASARRRDRRR